LCPVWVEARHDLRMRLEARPYLYSVEVNPDRRPRATPTPAARKPGRPRKATAGGDEAMGDSEEEGREPKRKRSMQTTLSFGTVDLDPGVVPSTLPSL